VQHVYLEYMGNSFGVPMGETIIGRDAGCMLRIGDAAVSRRHARLIRRHDEVFLEDLGSANGTVINGRTVVAPIRVRHGDVITIGGRDLTVSFEDPHDHEATVRIGTLANAAAERTPPMQRVGRRTTELPVVVPARLTANERCPRCSAVCAITDESCGNCGYRLDSDPGASGDSLNRRRHDRYSAALRVAYASARQQFEAATLDISENGAFVCSPHLDPVGTSCTLTLFVDTEAVRVGGVVRRVAGPESTHPELVGLGIELTQASDRERELLAALVARLANTES